MRAPVLDERALNRVTLARQLLLRRSPIAPLEAIERLVGLQAQEPQDPYVALWSRLARFRPGSLSRLIEERRAVRIVAMRATVHLLSADDCLALRPLTQPVVAAEIARHRDHAPALAGVDVAPVLAEARRVLAERPRSGRELRAALGERFPEHDAAALAYACRCLLPLVQVPPRGLGGRRAQVVTTTADAWLGRPLQERPSIEDMVLRYLGAFGPAAVADVATWSGLTGLREVVDRLRPRLVAVRDGRGRELLDLPDAPRPDPGTPAPPRFLPQFDDVLLAHADRSRFATPQERAALSDGFATGWGSLLVDGRARGRWRVERDRERGTATLLVRHLPGRGPWAAVEAEGRRLLRLLAGDVAGRDVRLEPVSPPGTPPRPAARRGRAARPSAGRPAPADARSRPG